MYVDAIVLFNSRRRYWCRHSLLQLVYMPLDTHDEIRVKRTHTLSTNACQIYGDWLGTLWFNESKIYNTVCLIVAMHERKACEWKIEWMNQKKISIETKESLFVILLCYVYFSFGIKLNFVIFFSALLIPAVSRKINNNLQDLSTNI